MFWTEAGSSPKIEKANMDNGNGRTTVISNAITYPAGIAVDSSSKIMHTLNILCISH